MKRVAIVATVLFLGGCTHTETSDERVRSDPQALGGTNLGGTNLGGTNLGGTNLGGTNLGGANLGGTNLGGTNLGGTNLGGTNLGGANLGGTNLGGTNLGGTNLGGTNLGGTNLGGTNLGGTNLGGTNLGGTNLAGNGIGGTNLTPSNFSAGIAGRAIHGEIANGMLSSGEDLFQPRTASCVVMGIGSTAFAKLVGQQSVSATMYASIKKTPWGFASTAGGPVQLSAWEAVVWGDKTYCVFVLAAPTNATYPGVAGFVKSIWRWAAPPAQVLQIGQIGGGQPIQSHGGMMNAAAKWRGGQLPEKSYVAGELAFVTATTNNQVVDVDFASWARDGNLDSVILGNVAGAPVSGEAMYAALDNGDGTVQIVITSPFAGPPPGGVTDGLQQLASAYEQWQAGAGPKPVAKRCAGALYLHDRFGEPLPVEKCDGGLSWAPRSEFVGSMSWASFAGTRAPYNSYMQATQPGGAFQFGHAAKPVLGATYVHLNERAW